jgi:Ribose/xylose/arabinose/galactoside ABC-type transport systems, permease components
MNEVKKIFKIREITSFLFLIVLFAIVGSVNSSFLSPTSLLNCFNDSVVFTLLAVGIAFVILTGEIDVSIGATLGLSAAVSSTLLRDGSNWAVAFAAGLLVGVVVGLINGFGVSVLNVPSLIFTLGTNGLIRGSIYVFTNGAWVENLPPAFTKLSKVKLAGDLTVFYVAVIVLVIIAHFVLTRTRRGKYFIAVGDNAAGATLVGIPAVNTKIIAYILCGLFASVAGIIYSARIGFITPTAGSGYEMKAIAACVLGGISLTGGLGSLVGASIGAVIMSSVSRILVFLGFSSDYDNTITGILLIAIVVIDAVSQNRAAVKNRHMRLAARASTVKGDEQE